MGRGIYNYSEIGKLNKALLHRPGAELEALTPDTLKKMLFEDIPFLKVSKKEHDDFAQLLRDNGVQVMYYVDEAAKALADPEVRRQFFDDLFDLSKISVSS